MPEERAGWTSSAVVVAVGKRLGRKGQTLPSGVSPGDRVLIDMRQCGLVVDGISRVIPREGDLFLLPYKAIDAVLGDESVDVLRYRRAKDT